MVGSGRKEGGTTSSDPSLADQKSAVHNLHGDH